MGLFKEIAEPLIARNVPVIPLRPKTKIAFLTNWQDIATTNSVKIDEWDQEYADANAACVAFARQDGIWFLEIDRAGFAQTIEQQAGHKIPETFTVRSSPGRGHYYFKQTAASIAMGNAQGTDNEGKESWSARVDNRYVVAPGSYHPTSGKRYETLRDVPIVEAPDWLVAWCSKSISTSVKTGHAELDDESPIIEGNRNNAITSILGKARQVLAMDREQLYQYGLSVNQKRCKPQMSDAEVRTIANSVASYEVKQAPPVIMGGRILGQDLPAVYQPPAIVPAISKPVPYPSFPRWVMNGTSIGDGFVTPVCAVNSRYPEFMFMPAMVLVLNYVATKVRVASDPNMVPSFYMVSIGRKGRVIKSSSVNDAIEYLKTAGVVNYGGGQRSADSKTLVWTVGSTEGLGLEMSRTNCKNAVLFYDELSTLTNKAAIEGSSLKSNLLTMYESGQFANTIKSRRENFSFDPRTYCTSLIACTTDKNFHSQWSNMSGGSSGLDERFFFLYQPETLAEPTPIKFVNTTEATVKTRQLLDKAVLQAIYSISDDTPIEQKFRELGNRTMHRVIKMALFFAIDMGKEEIDEECVDRALAIAKYEVAVKKYLAAVESTTKEGALQGEIIRLLQQHNGVMTTRELDRALHPERHGTFLWQRVYGGLIQAGWITEDSGTAKNSTKQVILIRLPEIDED